MSIIPPEPYCDDIPEQFTLGETSAEIKISSIEENRQAAVSLVSQARQEINIFTQDMDDALFNNNDFENHIYNLAMKHPGAKVKILVQNSNSAVKNGHCLIRLSQKLTSSIFIRNPAEEYEEEKGSFLTVDGLGMLYRARTDAHNYNASFNFMSPRRTKKLNEFFNEIWEQSVRDPHVRRFFI